MAIDLPGLCRPEIRSAEHEVQSRLEHRTLAMVILRDFAPDIPIYEALRQFGLSYDGPSATAPAATAPAATASTATAPDQRCSKRHVWFPDME